MGEVGRLTTERDAEKRRALLLSVELNDFRRQHERGCFPSPDKERAEKAEAACAAMREALGAALVEFDRLGGYATVRGWILSALATDAGRDYWPPHEREQFIAAKDDVIRMDREHIAKLEAACAAMRAGLAAAGRILWMAKKYAEASGAHGPEMREFRRAEQRIGAANAAEAGRGWLSPESIRKTCTTSMACPHSALRSAATPPEELSKVCDGACGEECISAEDHERIVRLQAKGASVVDSETGETANVDDDDWSDYDPR
jgi:hypothetical protein